MSTTQYGLLVTIILAVLAVFQTLGMVIVGEILKKKIEFEFKKREQAALIASLFSEWIDKPENRKELNRLTWEANLWLPDNIANEVNKSLAHRPDAKDIREIIVSVKGLIQGKKSSLLPSSIVYFPKDTTKETTSETRDQL